MGKLNISYLKTSTYIGVRFNKKRNNYKATICYNKKLIHLGYFDNGIDAAKAYDCGCIKYYGPLKRRNFPAHEPENIIPNTRLVRLTKGMFAIVDEDDFEKVNQYKWNALISGKKMKVYRAVSSFPNNKTMQLHRFILNADEKITVNHINRNTLDCRKTNMRLCTQKQNSRNRTKRVGSYLNTKEYDFLKKIKDIYQ